MIKKKLANFLFSYSQIYNFILTSEFFGFDIFVINIERFLWIHK